MSAFSGAFSSGIANLSGVFTSGALNMSTHLHIILPEPDKMRGTLLLLHGLKGGSEDWQRKTSIERYAAEYGLAVFMPEVQRSWYIDMKYGLPYFTYVSEELPAWIESQFRAPTDPKHLYVAGLSMGGFGALKLALTHPDRFAGCMSLSPRLYLRDRLEQKKDELQDRKEWKAILGDDLIVGPENDLELLAEAAAKGPVPRIYLACGAEDSLYPESVRMRDYLRSLGINITYEEWSGIHSWVFWDKAIQRGLEAVVTKER